jgi:DEAD/DEAH box helicase domain-containing protein
VQDILRLLEEEGFVHLALGQWNWTNESYPADAVSLRSVSSDNFVIVDTTNAPRIIGETDYTSAFSTLHEKAIYIVEGQLYQVERLDIEGRKAYVREVDCDYYTDAISYTKVTILDEFAATPALDPAADAVAPAGQAGGAVHAHGEVQVVSRVVGFKKIKFYTNENVGSGELDLPEQQMHTSSYWLTVPREVMAALPFELQDRRDGVSGLAYAMRNIAQLLLMCDRQDVGLSVDTGEPEAGPQAARDAAGVEPRVFIYDNYPGGIGLSEPLHGMRAQLLRGTRQLIADCTCESGCPSCVGPLGEVGPNTKVVASRLLSLLLSNR